MFLALDHRIWRGLLSTLPVLCCHFTAQNAKLGEEPCSAISLKAVVQSPSVVSHPDYTSSLHSALTNCSLLDDKPISKQAPWKNPKRDGKYIASHT
jgi:hypothetical protein